MLIEGASRHRIWKHFLTENYIKTLLIVRNKKALSSRAAVVHLNFRAGSTFPVPVYTASAGH